MSSVSSIVSSNYVKPFIVAVGAIAVRLPFNHLVTALSLEVLKITGSSLVVGANAAATCAVTLGVYKVARKIFDLNNPNTFDQQLKKRERLAYGVTAIVSAAIIALTITEGVVPCLLGLAVYRIVQLVANRFKKDISTQEKSEQALPFEIEFKEESSAKEFCEKVANIGDKTIEMKLIENKVILTNSKTAFPNKKFYEIYLEARKGGKFQYVGAKIAELKS